MIRKFINDRPFWLSGNAFVSEAGSLRFKSRAGQIGHNVDNGLPPWEHFFKRSCVTRARRNTVVKKKTTLCFKSAM